MRRARPLESSAVLVKHRYTAQLATVPFRFVFVHFWVDGLEEGSHEGYLAGGPNDGAFIPDILDYIYRA